LGKHSPTPSNSGSATSKQAREYVDDLFDFTDDEYDSDAKELAKGAVKTQKKLLSKSNYLKDKLTNAVY
jgi:hypothetical protein